MAADHSRAAELPREVEEAIAAVPGVRSTLVRGDPDPTWGEAVTAYVVPEDPAAGDQLTVRIRRALEARLARYKLPKQLHLVDSLRRSRRVGGEEARITIQSCPT